MNERYPIPLRDLKKGVRITGSIMFGVYDGMRPTAELAVQQQAHKFLKAFFGRKRI